MKLRGLVLLRNRYCASLKQYNNIFNIQNVKPISTFNDSNRRENQNDSKSKHLFSKWALFGLFGGIGMNF